MAPIAERFVRLSVEPGFAARFRAAGNDAGHEFARSFRLRVQAQLASMNFKVRVTPDFAGFHAPSIPPINLRVGFDMTSAIQAGRRAAQVANAAAGPINLHVNGGAGVGSMFGFVNVAGSQIQSLAVNIMQVTNNMTQAASAANSFGNSLSDLGGPLGQAFGIAKVAAMITLLPAAAWTAIGAIYALGGALGSIPALSVGLGASVGALGIGFMGLGQHLKATAAGGGGAAKSLLGLHNAERALARSKRELLKATKDIDRARRDEIERIDDLGRALRGAYLDEEDAVTAVAEARRRLAEARESGDANEIGAADRAYRRSLLTLDEARDKVGDLQADQDDANKKGVEGSDAMQQAYERQRDAVEAVTAAEEALAEARKSAGGGGMAQQLMKLAPAAQEVVDKLRQLKPAFEEVRLAVQQSLFEGVAPELQKLADAWKKPLQDTLTSYSSTYNGLFKNLSASVRKPEFIKDISSAAETVRTNIDKIGKAITGPFVAAFGTLAQAAKPFIDTLGDKIAGMVEHFSEWIDSAAKSGDLQKFFQDAAYYLGQIWDIGGNVLGLFGDLFAIVFDTENQGGSKPFLESVNEKLIMLREWLADPENKKRIQAFVDRLGEWAERGREFTNWLVEEGLPALSRLMSKIEDVIGWVDSSIGAFERLLVQWRRFKEAVGAPLAIPLTIFDGITAAMRYALNKAIDLFNSLNLGVKINVSGGSVGISGTAMPLPAANKPRPFADGGVVRATPGGVTGQIAEAGKDEAIAPIDVLKGYVRDAVAEGGGGHGETTIAIYMFPNSAEYDRFVISAAERNKGAITKIVNGGNKRLGYAG